LTMKTQQVKLIFVSVILFVLIVIALVQFYFFGNEWQRSAPALDSHIVNIWLLTPSVAYWNTSFNASFTNGWGGNITLEDITLKEEISGAPCSHVTVWPSNVNAGGTFTVTGVCLEKAGCEEYDLLVTFRYNSMTGGIATNHTEWGHVKGRGEPC
jgi:hypothetical protein